MNEIIKKITKLTPSEFYCKVWKAHFSGQLPKKKLDRLVVLYETHREDTGENIKEVFGS